MSWGLVLSGGAALGIANIGILEVLEKEGLKPNAIAGSSMGAIIGAVAAMEVPVEKMKELADKIQINNFAEFSEKFFKDGLHGGYFRHRVEQYLQPLLGEACIGDCPIPFVCIAGRVKEKLKWEKMINNTFMDHAMEIVEKHVFSPDTKLIDAVTASSAIPVLFSPVELNGEEYIDLCNFGVIPARTMKEVINPDVVVATNTVPRLNMLLESLLPHGLVEFIKAGRSSVDESLAVCDLVIQPEVKRSQLFRFDKTDDFIEAGRVAAEEKIPEVKELIMNN